MAIVKTDVPMTSERNEQTILDLVKRYPFLRTEVLKETAYGRNLRTLVIGKGKRKLIYAASFHANEWITTPLLLKFVEEFAQAIEDDGEIFGVSAPELADFVTIYTVPMVNPDGVDLVTGAIEPGSVQYEKAKKLAERYPQIPFVDGWKANLLGVDLNLQYPTGWLQARENKFAQGYTRPGPRDYVGRAPLNQVESKAMAGYTEYLDPALILALHSQGGEIYWKYQDVYVPGAYELGQRLEKASGYALQNTPYESGFAGYKDWFINTFRRPGYTIEVGKGTNPLPITQFDEIYKDVLGIFVTAAMG